MKRSRPPVRRAPLTTGRRKPLRASGETKRKKRKRYEAYLKSPEWKAKRDACIIAAGGRCEVYWEIVGISAVPNLEGRGKRCWRRPKQAHHKTYARFGGDELPEDLAACCIPCHRGIEQTYYPHRHPTQNPGHIAGPLGDVLARIMDGEGDDA